jgi:hypothetical protein
VCPSVRLPGLADDLFEGIGCEDDASATILEPCPWWRCDGHEFTDDPLPSRAYPEFATAYQRVRATVVEDWLDDMIEIVDHPELDPLDKRVRIDARRWIMSKAAPRRYGDKVIIGGDGNLGIGGSISLSDLSDEQLVALEQLAALRLPADDVGAESAPTEPDADEASEG